MPAKQLQYKGCTNGLCTITKPECTATEVHTFILHTCSHPSSLACMYIHTAPAQSMYIQTAPAQCTYIHTAPPQCMYIHTAPAQCTVNKGRLLSHQQFTALIPGFHITHHINDSPCFDIHWLRCNWLHRFCHLRWYWPRSRRRRLSGLERSQRVNTVPENADNGHPYKLINTHQTLTLNLLAPTTVGARINP